MANFSASSAPFTPQPGVPLVLSGGLRLVLAPNASPMTERGTNTYLLGEGSVTVIDPGPADPAHVTALLAALRPGERISRILVTHTHLDHSPAARPLAQQTGAPVLAFGAAGAGRSPRMAALAGHPIGGGEGVDQSFTPDETLTDGDELPLENGVLRVLHTPGHLGNHLCFQWNDRLFSGDHVMGWAPSLVSPPDGDLTDFMASLTRLSTLGPLHLYPGHGAPVTDGQQRILDLLAHRRGRETAIRQAVDAGAITPEAVTRAVYTDVPTALLPAALRNVLAHLIDLEGRGLIAFDGPVGPHTALSGRAA